MASFLLGTPALIEQDFLLVFPGIRGTEWGGFFQDDWRVSDRLTLNLGLRYEYDTPYSEVADRWTNFDVVTGKLLIAGYNTDRGRCQPRIRITGRRVSGLPTKRASSTVVRGGFRRVLQHARQRIGFAAHAPADAVRSDTDGNHRPVLQHSADDVARLPATAESRSCGRHSQPNGRLPGCRSQFQERLRYAVQPANPAGTALELVAKVGYVGNLGRQLDYTYQYNQPDPGPNTGVSPAATNLLQMWSMSTYMTSDGRSRIIRCRRRWRSDSHPGLSFLTAYTWAHSIDNVPNAFGGAANGPFPQDIRYRNNDRGDSSFDIRHRFTHSMNYELPFGQG